jgi:hypothetical protein
MKTDKTLANKNKDCHRKLKLKKKEKNNLIITLKSIIFGANANSNVTLVIAPS